MLSLKYSRILLKLSGEALGGNQGIALDPSKLQTLAEEIKAVHSLGVKVAVVVGAGNIFRGIESPGFKISHVQGDLIGMEATIINGLLLKEVLESLGLKSVALSALGETSVVKAYSTERGKQYLSDDQVVICVGGTGNPFFTTDSTAVLRGLELNCDVVLKGTKVDGIYSDDPVKNKEAVKYETLPYEEAIAKNLRVMDQTAFVLAQENKIPLIVFNLFEKDALKKIVQGEKVGTMVQ